MRLSWVPLWTVLGCASGLAAGCGEATDGSGRDGANDSFLAALDAVGHEDLPTLHEAQVPELLDLVNRASFDELVDRAGLDTRAAWNIVAHRAGADGEEGTADDLRLDSLAELDAIAYVGPHAYAQLVRYARERGFITGTPLVLRTALEETERVWQPSCRAQMAVRHAEAELRIATRIVDGVRYLEVALDSPESQTQRYLNCGGMDADGCAGMDRALVYRLPVHEADAGRREAQMVETASGEMPRTHAMQVVVDGDALRVSFDLRLGNMSPLYACEEPGFHAQASAIMVRGAERLFRELR